MIATSSLYSCTESEFIKNTVIALNPTPTYQIPMLASDLEIASVEFDFHDSISRTVEFTRPEKVTVDGEFVNDVFGRLKQVCSTEAEKINAKVNTKRLTLRVLSAKYEVDNLIMDPSYQMQNDVSRVIVELRDTSARQIEFFGYLGYKNTTKKELSKVAGLNGLVDISTPFENPPVLPMLSNDYQSLCEFFTNGINQARSQNAKNEYSKSDISVHVASDIVDKINCSILSNTTIGLWDKLKSGVLSSISPNNLIVSDQISNKVFFCNNRRIFGVRNSILKNLPPTFSEGTKISYYFLLGTISFVPKGTVLPVVYADNVIDFSS